MPIVEKNIKVNETGAEAYKYLYTNLDKNNKKYGGSHLGEPEDEYKHSSTSEEFAEDLLTDKFRFDILEYGTYPEMQASENIWLSKQNLPNPNWYNKWAGFSPKDISDVPDVDRMGEFADTILQTGTYGNNEIEYIKFDKKNWENDPLSKLIFLQTRVDTLIDGSVKKIREIVDNAIGDLDKTGISLMVVVLKDRLVKINGKVEKKDLCIGGNHTFEAIKSSKHCNHMPILYITEAEHKDFSDTEIDVASLSLNPRELQPKTSSSFDDIAKQVYKIRVKNPGIQDNRHSEIRKLYKRFHLTASEIKVVNEMVSKLLKSDNAADTNWINWTVGKWKTELDKEREAFEKNPHTVSTIQSSGRPSFGDDLMDIAARLQDGETIEAYLPILHHKNPDNLAKYNKKYRALNDKAFVYFAKKLGIRIQVVEKQTVASELDTK